MLPPQVARRKGGAKREEEQRSRRKRIEEQQETIGLLKRLFFWKCCVLGIFSETKNSFKIHSFLSHWISPVIDATFSTAEVCEVAFDLIL